MHPLVDFLRSLPAILPSASTREFDNERFLRYVTISPRFAISTDFYDPETGSPAYERLYALDGITVQYDKSPADCCPSTFDAAVGLLTNVNWGGNVAAFEYIYTPDLDGLAGGRALSPKPAASRGVFFPAHWKYDPWQDTDYWVPDQWLFDTDSEAVWEPVCEKARFYSSDTESSVVFLFGAFGLSPENSFFQAPYRGAGQLSSNRYFGDVGPAPGVQDNPFHFRVETSSNYTVSKTWMSFRAWVLNYPLYWFPPTSVTSAPEGDVLVFPFPLLLLPLIGLTGKGNEFPISGRNGLMGTGNSFFGLRVITNDD